MSLTTVLSISLIPAKARIYEDGVRRLAERARDQRDAFHWRTYQVVAGQQGVIHFVSQAQDFAELAKRDMTPQALVLRLLGEKEGAKLGEELASCSAASRYTIARERPDLSYPPDSRTEVLPMSVVTVLRTQPPHPRRSRPPAAAHRIAHQSIRCRGRWSDLALRYGGARDGGALDQPAATGSVEPGLSAGREAPRQRGAGASRPDSRRGVAGTMVEARESNTLRTPDEGVVHPAELDRARRRPG